MVTLLTDKQREEVVEAMARAAARMVPSSAGNWIEPHGHDFPRQYSSDEVLRIRSLFDTALTAALPAIERAVLERAAARCDIWAADEDRANEIRNTAAWLASDIRALAGEVG